MIKITDLNKEKEIVFDNINYTISEKDFGTAEVNLLTSQSFRQLGETVQGRTIGKRSVSLVGYCLAETEEEMLQRKRLLQNVASINRDFYIIVNDTYQLQVSANSSVEFATSYAENNKFLCKFLIDATAANPFFKEIEETETSEFYYQVPKKIITNNSDCALGLRIELYFRDISAFPKNPYIINHTTGERIDITYTFQFGVWDEKIIINTHYGNKNAKVVFGEDVLVANAIPRISDTSSFFSLEEGQNIIEIGAEENGSSLGAKLYYNNCFLGV